MSTVRDTTRAPAPAIGCTIIGASNERETCGRRSATMNELAAYNASRREEAESFRDERVAAFARDVIGSDRFAWRPYWKVARVRRLLEDHLSGRREAGETLWKCINLELWLRAFFGRGKPASGE